MPVTAQIVGTASGNTDTFVIPVGVNVPRSTPTVYSAIGFFGPTVIAGLTSITDDATPQDDYSFCLFLDGLNTYNVGGGTPNLGGIANDLTAGVHSITCVTGSVQPWGQLIAVNFVGLGPVGGSGVAPLLTGAENPLQLAETPVGGGTDFSPGVTWGYGLGFPPNLFDPTGTDTNWDWVNGELAVYPFWAADAAPLIGWTWADGSITDWIQMNETDGTNYYSTVLGLAAVTPGAAGPSLQGTWGGGQVAGSGQHGLAYVSGHGPGECNPTPPPFGNPTFNKVIPV